MTQTAAGPEAGAVPAAAHAASVLVGTSARAGRHDWDPARTSSLRARDPKARLRSSPRKNSGDERWPQPLLQSGARKRADDSVDLLAVPDHNEQRDRLRSKLGGESWIRVDIDLDDLEMPRVMLREVFKHRRDHPTGPAPRRPEIHHHRHRRGRLGRERAGVRIHDPWERGLAPRASGDSLGDRADAIPCVTGRAADDGHDHQSRIRPSRGTLARRSDA